MPLLMGITSLYYLLQCKAMLEVKLSSKNQIVVPRDARSALGLHAGDKLLVVIRGDKAILLRKPKKHSQAIVGMARNVYPAGYLDSERKSWELAGRASKRFLSGIAR